MTDYLKKLAEMPIETSYPENDIKAIRSRQVALLARALLQLKKENHELKQMLVKLKDEYEDHHHQTRRGGRIWYG